MMRSRRCLALAIILWGEFTGLISPGFANAPLGSAIYDTLSANNLLDNRFEPLLHEVFGTLLNRINFPLPLRMNEKYAEKSLNIYIVKPIHSLNNLTITQDQVRQVLKATTDNAVAIPPDLLIFDATFLADYILNAWNLETALVQALAEMNARTKVGLPAEEAINVISAFARRADVYRFQNIANSVANNRSGTNPTIVLSQYISQALTAGEGDSRMVLFALAPILYHELGHLREGTSGAFFEFLEEIARHFASPEILRREDAADQVAVDLLQKLALGFGDYSLTDYEAMVSSVLLMRDTVLFDVFSGFRGLSAEDHFIRLVHQDCRRTPSSEKRDFYDPQEIEISYHSFISFITADEFRELRAKGLATYGAGTHAHNFVRGTRFIGALTALGERLNAPREDDVLDWYIHFLSAVQRDDPGLLIESVTPAEKLAAGLERWREIVNLTGGGKTKGLGLSFDSVSQKLDLNYKPAVNCKPGMCMVGFFKDGQKGFVELGGPLDNLMSVRFAYPLVDGNPTKLLGSDDLEGYKESKEYKRRITILRRILSTALDIPENETGTLDSLLPLDDLISIARKCGAIDRIMRYNGKSVFLTSVNPDLWINAIVLP